MLRDEDVPLLVDIIRAVAGHRNRCGNGEPALLAAEESPPYGDGGNKDF
jgi:hypothetical protein